MRDPTYPRALILSKHQSIETTRRVTTHLDLPVSTHFSAVQFAHLSLSVLNLFHHLLPGFQFTPLLLFSAPRDSFHVCDCLLM